MSHLPHPLPPTRHIPILLEPIADFLVQGLTLIPPTAPAGILLDCTLGGGGHTARIMEKIALESAKNPSILRHTLVGIDQDPDAIERNRIRFSTELERQKIELHHLAFEQAIQAAKGRPIYGILADLGISSDQIDSEHRGFSFRFPAPLDMRMNPMQGQSLYDFILHASETELADVIWKYGEERLSRKIARRLISLREQGNLPKTSSDLAECIAQVFPPALRYKRTHPATQTFQAFRIFLNRELEQLEFLIHTLLTQVETDARIAILTFHSLEDRIVKHALRNADLYELPSRKAIEAPDSEVEANSRARSAKLRLAIRKKK
jgi:16S rRNA (cytosine1402-N4)-methyltransferase